MSRQYLSAGNIVNEVDSGKSFKAHCASIGSIGKVDYALAAETLKYKEILESIFQQCEISAAKLDVKNGVLLVMAYELLFGTGKVKGGGVVKRKIMEHLDAMKACVAKLMIGKTDSMELLSKNILEAASLPKYVRINESKLSIQDGLKYIQSIHPEAKLDKFVPSLVVLPANSKSLGQNEYVQDGRLIIQDKASCFPSQILANHYIHSLQNTTTTGGKKGQNKDEETQKNVFVAGGDFIDACAAPGNKTSHLAANVEAHFDKLNKHKQQQRSQSQLPKVFAFDKSVTRSQLLSARMHQAGVDHVVHVQNRDFLSLDVNDPQYSRVTSVLLDPSCSGSGVVRAVERVHETEGNDSEYSANADGRLDKLRNFQIMALRKALTFPQIQRVAYSTCSTHNEENEDVVAEVLNNTITAATTSVNTAAQKTLSTATSSANSTDDTPSAVICDDWQLVAPLGFESWTRRGHAVSALTAQQSECLVRCLPADGTNGFFVAMFERKPGSTVQYNRVTIAGTGVVEAGNNSTSSSHQSGNTQGKGGKKRKNTAAVDGAVDGQDESTAAAAALAVIPRSQRQKTHHIVAAATSASLITTGSLFGKKRFTVSKSAKKKAFGRKK